MSDKEIKIREIVPMLQTLDMNSLLLVKSSVDVLFAKDKMERRITEPPARSRR